jgi:hypothetical protein
MKLTELQIQGIDTYLKNSEVEFVDVRMGMLDHVACDYEWFGVFYYILVLRFSKKERYSGFERMSLFLVLRIQIIQLFISPYYQQTVFENYENTDILFVSFLLVLGFSFIATLLQFKKEYTHRYKNLLV